MDEQAQAVADDGSVSVLSHARRRLGRGLNALLGNAGSETEPGEETTTDLVADDNIPVGAIEVNPFQPRKDFAPEALTELAESIKLHGLLQPVLVRPCGGRFQLIAGERRWRAAQQAGLATVPCRILELEDQQVYEVAIEENLKRKDLGVLEKADAFRDYLARFGCTIEELAGRLSMNRATLSNYLRLLDLPDAVKKAVNAEKISNGHARALLTLEESDQIALCRRIISEGLSVRKTETAVREIQQARHGGDGESADVIPMDQSAAAKPETSSHVQSLQEQLRSLLGVKVEIQVKGKESGRILIPFTSTEEFEHILRQLRRAA